MGTDGSPWSIRAALISVHDLDRSSAFYQDVMNVREVYRRQQIAVLGTEVTGPFTFYLREVKGNAVHPGQQSIGLRALSCDVGSLSELDRVEERLRALGSFQDRLVVDSAAKFELVHGHDPDRVSLTFSASGTDRPPTFDEETTLASIYSVDI